MRKALRFHYTRCHVDPNADVGSISLRLKFPDGAEAPLSSFDEAAVKKVQADTRAKGTPLSGFLLIAVLGMVKLPTPGRILAIVTIGGQDVLAAGINFELAPADTAVATASARPFADTEAFEQSRRERKKIEMRFAHLKRILRLGRLRLRGPQGAQDEFVLAAIAQNLRRFASLVTRPPPTMALCAA